MTFKTNRLMMPLLWALILGVVGFFAPLGAQENDSAANSPNDSASPDETTDADEKEADETESDENDSADAPDDASDDSTDAPPTDPIADWDALMKQKKQIMLDLEEMRKEYETASQTRKQELFRQFNQRISEYNFLVRPKLLDLAVAVYEKQPDNLEAAEMALQKYFDSTQLTEARDLGEKLLKEGRKSPAVLNTTGKVHFYLQDFERARELLKEAADSGVLERTGGFFSAESIYKQVEPYIEYWKKEKQIREAEATDNEAEQLPRVELVTEKGKIVAELFENEAPNTVANFIDLIESGQYDGNPFHRVIPNFVIQGGQLPGETWTIKCECYTENARKHFRGNLSMAHAGKDTGSSQFFITHIPTYWLNEETFPSSVHTVFGRVIDGMDVVDEIEPDDKILSAKVLRKRPHDYEPNRVDLDDSGTDESESDDNSE